MFSKQELYHPRYSPDISPCDYDLIPKMSMRGKRYRTIEDVKQVADRSLRTINWAVPTGSNDFHVAGNTLYTTVGDYIEGLWNLEPSRWAIYPVITLVPKLKNQPMHKTIILLVVLYGCESWSLTFSEEQKLRVFENKVLMKIFRAKKDEITGEGRKLHIAELHALYSSPYIIRSQSRWLR